MVHDEKLDYHPGLWPERVVPPPWRLIDDDTPRDKPIIVFAPGDDPDFHEPLNDIVCLCQWHPDAGFCIDELRHPTHWMPYEKPRK